MSDALPIPPDMIGNDKAHEVVRGWFADGGVFQCSLQPAFKDPAVWGRVLAELTWHVARMYADMHGTNTRNISEKIAEVYAQVVGELNETCDTDRIFSQ